MNMFGLSFKSLARKLCVVLMLASFVSSAGFGWRLAANWPTSLLVERTGAEISVGINRALARYTDATTIEVQVIKLLHEEPRNWLVIESIENIATERGVEFSQKTAKLREERYDQDHGFGPWMKQCGTCFFDVTSCNFSNLVFCRTPIELTPIGDLASFVRAGKNSLNGSDIDKVDLGLSAIGLTAFFLIPATGGNSAWVKVGASLAKILWRMGKLSKGLVSPISKAVSEGFDWSKISSVRSIEDLKSLVRPKALRPAQSLVKNFGRLNKAVGLSRALHLLSKVDTPAEVNRITDVAEEMGPDTLGALKLLGKSRFMRATMKKTLRWTDEIWELVASLVGLVTGILGLLLSMFGTVLARALRRIAK